MKLKRSLYGYGPLPSDRLTTTIEIPEYLWSVAMALTDFAESADRLGEYEIAEAKARALATAMGCVLPAKHRWYIRTEGVAG